MSKVSIWADSRFEYDGPLMLPVLNLMTGPPDLLRNGGIWKYLKQFLILEEKAPALMTHAFHFLEFGIRKDALASWVAGPGGRDGFRGWFEHLLGRKRGPQLFVDSGGFQFLNGPSPDLSKYGLEANATGIMKLQLGLQADAVASLDFPLMTGIGEDEVRRRIRLSLRNCDHLLASLRPQETRPFPYLCVHAVDKSGAVDYVRKVVRIAARHGYSPGEFGLAIGSLVPIRSHSQLIFGILRGAREALASEGAAYLLKTPIHVFGVSGALVPYLYLLGVNSFDSSAYARAAVNLRYFLRFPFVQADFRGLQELTCACRYCNRLNEAGLDEVKRVLSAQPYRTHPMGNEQVHKSLIYALVAMHNWTALAQGLESLRNLDHQELVKRIVRISLTSPLGRNLLTAAAIASPELAESAPSHTIGSAVPGGVLRYPNLKPRFTPDDFDLQDYDFSPESDRLLLMACSATKPYSSSRSHQRVVSVLRKDGVSEDDVDIVSISGLYGPVPRRYETVPQIMGYDFRLTRYHPKQRNLVTQRTAVFLSRHSRRYRTIIAYLSSGVYRQVVKDAAAKARVGLSLLPAIATKKAYYDEACIGELSRRLARSTAIEQRIHQ